MITKQVMRGTDTTNILLQVLLAALICMAFCHAQMVVTRAVMCFCDIAHVLQNKAIKPIRLRFTRLLEWAYMVAVACL